MTFEVVTRWGDELLDVQYCDERCRIGDVDIALVDGARGHVGLVAYAVSKATLPPRSVPYARGDDRRVVPYFGVALLAHLAVWGAATTTRREPTREKPERPRVAKVLAEATYDVPDDDGPDKSEDTKAPGSGTPMELAEGAAGAPDVMKERGHIAVEKRAPTPQLSKNLAIEEARNAGVLGSSAITSESFKALTGSADLASGFDGASINSTLTGDEGTAFGNFGASIEGDYWGGDGNQWGTIGVGELGSFSNGVGEGEGWGSGPHVPGWGIAVSIDICGGDNDCVHGDVDERVIRRVVRRHAKKLTRCWYAQHVRSHDLSKGPLAVDFTIGRNGRVRLAHATGISAAVESCVAGVYRRMKFPRMRDLVQIRQVLVYDVRVR